MFREARWSANPEGWTLLSPHCATGEAFPCSVPSLRRYASHYSPRSSSLRPTHSGTCGLAVGSISTMHTHPQDTPHRCHTEPFTQPYETPPEASGYSEAPPSPVVHVVQCLAAPNAPLYQRQSACTMRPSLPPTPLSQPKREATVPVVMWLVLVSLRGCGVSDCDVSDWFL